MKTQIFIAIRLTFFCIVLFVFVYSGIVFLIAQLIAPNKGEGETIRQSGKVVGFANVGQAFISAKYFWPRPSAAGFNAAASAGSNKGPSNLDYLNTVQHRIDLFLAQNPSVKKDQISAELVTASGSGLDPQISPASAYLQAARIASVRNISVEKILALIDVEIRQPLLGFMGPSVVNVLSLNVALDKLQ